MQGPDKFQEEINGAAPGHCTKKLGGNVLVIRGGNPQYIPDIRNQEMVQFGMITLPALGGFRKYTEAGDQLNDRKVIIVGISVIDQGKYENQQARKAKNNRVTIFLKIRMHSFLLRN